MSEPVPSADTLYVKFWGVRGSVSAAGSRFEEFGGNTPCVEVRCGERLFIIDAGTGIIPLGLELAASGPPEIDIVLSHLHLDHVSGLPFFKPALLPDRHIRLHCGNLRGESAEEAFGRLFSPPLFPISLSQLPGKVEHLGFKSGDVLTFHDGATTKTLPLNHPGGATGYRFDFRGRSVCYISDIEHTVPWPPEDLRDFVAGTDLVIFDGMFSETEYIRCQGWGHSTWQKGVDLCRAAGVEALAVFHLHPQHDDAYLHEEERKVSAAMPGAFLAREGRVLSFTTTS
ncbi:MBL fold metallo-hydrolase [uncultured Enterovirga sp.]|uniref:MBL fold metallo-hydrolase n=1 Tax=uncultured Enterovirga sp. TaxID=2026352 RepID=UPI0035C95484